jgi:hypothetical protein
MKLKKFKGTMSSFAPIALAPNLEKVEMSLYCDGEPITIEFTNEEFERLVRVINRLQYDRITVSDYSPEGIQRFKTATNAKPPKVEG